MIPPDLSLVVKIDKICTFIKWLPISYVCAAMPMCIFLPYKLLSFKFQIPTFILTLAINKKVIEYFDIKKKNDKIKNKVMFELLDDDVN